MFRLASGGAEIVRYQQKKQPIEINPEFRKSLDIMEDTNRHVFITGKAGTGKSTLLDYFRQTTGKDVAVLAPTGVAALNIQGQTIHSFFGFKPNITPDKIKKVTGKEGHIYKEFDTIIIDEISMVRADLLDCVEKFLRLNGPSPETMVWRHTDDLHRRPLSATASGNLGRKRDLYPSVYNPVLFFGTNI